MVHSHVPKKPAGSAGKEISCSRFQSTPKYKPCKPSEFLPEMDGTILIGSSRSCVASVLGPLICDLHLLLLATRRRESDGHFNWENFLILSPDHIKYPHMAFHGNKSNSKRGSNRYIIPCNCCWIPTGSHLVCGTYPIPR